MLLTKQLQCLQSCGMHSRLSYSNDKRQGSIVSQSELPHCHSPCARNGHQEKCMASETLALVVGSGGIAGTPKT